MRVIEMRDVADLIKKAREMKDKGCSTGEIADELNISRETALWLVTHGIKERETMPKDIYIDWSAVGSNSNTLAFLSLALGELVKETVDENDLPPPDVIAGIAISGIPIATVIAEEMNASLAVIRPKKHQWEPGEKGEKDENDTGFLLSNFSEVKGKNVVIVDDIATTGTTIKEAIDLLEGLGATPIAAVVLIDKKGIRNIRDMPVKALISIGIVEQLGK
jgi:HTH-type transcriptional regulator, activator of D-glucose/D-fructose catabolism